MLFRSGWDYSLTPTLLNHLNIGYNRTNSKNFASNLNSATNLTSVGAPNFYSTAFPHVCFDGLDSYSCWGQTNNGDNIDNGLRLVDSVSWQKGAHSLTFGTDIRYQQYSPINNNSPSINFCAAQTSGYQGSGNNGNGLASELLGLACNGGQNVYSHQSRWI